MTTVDIQIPSTLALRDAAAFCASLNAKEGAEHYAFRFGPMAFVEPIGLLLVSDAIDRFRLANCTSRFTATGFEGWTYAAHMGFFKAFGLRFGKSPGQASGSTSYLPMSFVDCDLYRQSAADEYAEVGEFTDKWSAKVAAVLLQTDHGHLFDTVQYSLREIVRNVLEHSHSDRFSYCGQYWPNKNRVQIGLADRGVGLRETLSKNQRLIIACDLDAVQLAMLPGISRKGVLPQSRSSNDPWANSGFGLYMTSRLCQEGGSFALLSGNTSIELRGTEKKVQASSYSGTALQLELDLSTSENLASRLTRYREEGIALARTFLGEQNLTASMASTMLSRNFR